MRPFTRDDLKGLLAPQQAPCVSIYLAPPQTYPERQQGPIQFRNLLGQAEAMLRTRYPRSQAQTLLDKFQDAGPDTPLWTHPPKGLAAFSSPNVFQAFALARPVPTRAVVADSFHVKPLVRIAQSADRFHVLCLQREAVRLYEGNRDGLHSIEPVGVPLTVEAALGEEVRVQRKEQAAGGKSPGERYPAPQGPNAPAGHPGSGSDAKLDAERFFRTVDRAVWEHVSRPSDLPLVLAALPEQQAVFRSISHNPRLLERGIEQGPGLLSADQLRVEAWKCLEPYYLARLAKFVDDYHVARARGMASDDLAEVTRAVLNGRVGVLLVEADRVIPGRIDSTTGSLQNANPVETAVDDLLDDLAEKVIRTEGTVVVVPRERMPTATGLAATYRF